MKIALRLTKVYSISTVASSSVLPKSCGMISDQLDLLHLPKINYWLLGISLYSQNIYVYHRRLQGALRVLHHHYWILRRWLDCATIFQMSHLIHFGLVHRCQNRVEIFSFGGLYPLFGLRLEVLASDHVLGSILYERKFNFNKLFCRN